MSTFGKLSTFSALYDRQILELEWAVAYVNPAEVLLLLNDGYNIEWISPEAVDMSRMVSVERPPGDPRRQQLKDLLIARGVPAAYYDRPIPV
jgi:hypothetical protein